MDNRSAYLAATESLGTFRLCSCSRSIDPAAASPSQMGRFETRWLTADKNLSALSDLSGQWIDRVHTLRPPRGILLDMDSSVSPTHGEQEDSVWNATASTANPSPPTRPSRRQRSTTASKRRPRIARCRNRPRRLREKVE
jgi:hypothetical protein